MYPLYSTNILMTIDKAASIEQPNQATTYKHIYTKGTNNLHLYPLIRTQR